MSSKSEFLASLDTTDMHPACPSTVALEAAIFAMNDNDRCDALDTATKAAEAVPPNATMLERGMAFGMAYILARYEDRLNPNSQ